MEVYERYLKAEPRQCLIVSGSKGILTLEEEREMLLSGDKSRNGKGLTTICHHHDLVAFVLDQ